MTDLKTLLDREANRAPMADDSFERTIRLSHKRQRRRGLIVGVIAAAVAAVPLWFALGSSSHRTPVSRHPHPSVSPSPIRYSPETVRLRHQLRNLIHERQRLLRVAKRPCGRKGKQVLSCVGSHVLYLRLIALDRRISRLLNEVAASVLVGPNGSGPLPSSIALGGTDDSFDPPAEGASPRLSASRAVARYERTNPGFHLLPGTAAYLGRYTGSLNNGFGTRLAWGFTWNGCPSRYPAREGVLPPLGSRCREWFFIDATTGRMIVAIIPPVARHFTLPPAP